MEKSKKKFIILLIILFIVGLGLYLLSPTAAFAADKIDWDKTASTSEIKQLTDGGGFTLTLCGFSIKDGLCYMIASFLFTLMEGVGYLAAVITCLSTEMTFLDGMAEKMNSLIMPTASKIFTTDGSSNIIMLGIAVSMIGIIFALLKARVSEGAGKLVKLIALFVIAFLLTTNSVGIFSDINKAAGEVSNSVSQTMTGTASNASAIWDITVIKPWMLLTFDSTGPQNYGGKNANQSMSEYLKERFPGGVSDMSTVLGSLASYPNSDFAKSVIVMDSKDAEDALGAADVESHTRMAQEGFQGSRLGKTFTLFFLSIMLSIMAIAIGMLLTAAKMLAMVMFFLWPFYVLFAFFTSQGMEVVKRWLVMVVTIFALTIVIQFIFGMVMSIIIMLIGSAGTYGGVAISLLIIASLVLAIWKGWKAILMIIAPRGGSKAVRIANALHMGRSLSNLTNLIKGHGNAPQNGGDIPNMRDNRYNPNRRGGETMDAAAQNRQDSGNDVNNIKATDKDNANPNVDSGGAELGQVHNGDDPTDKHDKNNPDDTAELGKVNNGDEEKRDKNAAEINKTQQEEAARKAVEEKKKSEAKGATMDRNAVKRQNAKNVQEAKAQGAEKAEAAKRAKTQAKGVPIQKGQDNAQARANMARQAELDKKRQQANKKPPQSASRQAAQRTNQSARNTVKTSQPKPRPNVKRKG